MNWQLLQQQLHLNSANILNNSHNNVSVTTTSQNSVNPATVPLISTPSLVTNTTEIAPISTKNTSTTTRIIKEEKMLLFYTLIQKNLLFHQNY